MLNTATPGQESESGAGLGRIHHATEPAAAIPMAVGSHGAMRSLEVLLADRSNMDEHRSGRPYVAFDTEWPAKVPDGCSGTP